MGQQDEDLNSFYHVFIYTVLFTLSPVTHLRISSQSLTPPAMMSHQQKPQMAKLFSFMMGKNVLQHKRISKNKKLKIYFLTSILSKKRKLKIYFLTAILSKNRRLKMSFLTSILVSWLVLRLASSHWKLDLKSALLSMSRDSTLIKEQSLAKNLPF